jgi:hypothetical protein
MSSTGAGNLLRRSESVTVARSDRRRCARFPDSCATVVVATPLLDEAVDDTQALTVGVVNADEGLPLPGQRILGKDGFDRTLGFAGRAVDALFRVDDEDPVRFVDAVDRADVQAGEILNVDAGVGDDECHAVSVGEPGLGQRAGKSPEQGRPSRDSVEVLHVVINHLRLREPVSDATVDAAQKGMQLVVDAGALVARVAKVDETHLILILEFSTGEDADRIAREVGGPWMREHIRPLLAGDTDRSVAEVIASAEA